MEIGVLWILNTQKLDGRQSNEAIREEVIPKREYHGLSTQLTGRGSSIWNQMPAGREVWGSSVCPKPGYIISGFFQDQEPWQFRRFKTSR